MEESNNVQTAVCPICNNEFPSTAINVHANRCLFLNSQESASYSKRASCSKDDNVSKRIKHDFSPSSAGVSIEAPRDSKLDASTDKRAYDKSITVTSNVPLAEQVRPEVLSDYVGQDHVLGPNKVLKLLLDRHDIPSMILWGPPGCGKTTLAHIIAAQCKNRNLGLRFVKLSGTMCGVNDVKEIVKVASNELRNFKRRTVLFMDEIHRFNKLQQDIFLPHVENGTITLIGATTENPSFSLNSALLSRCRVIVLEKLQANELMIILERALTNLGFQLTSSGNTISSSTIKMQESHEPRWTIDRESVQWLADMCDGDARNALNSLQIALQAKDGQSGSCGNLSLDDIKDGIKRSHLLYDKKGDQHYNMISAVHKSIRASDDNATLYWLTRMLEGGEDPVFISRRLVRAAAEDIGLADPQALSIAVAAMHGCQLLGMPECDVLLAQCAVYLARAPKSQDVYRALLSAKSVIAQHKGPQPAVPLHLRNATSRLTKDLGWSKGYNMKHKDDSGLNYLPESMEAVKFF